MNNGLGSLRFWFCFLLILVVLDIFTTTPAFEGNPFTLYLWAQIGIFLSAWIKIGQVLFFGLLCLSAWRVSKPNEWFLTKKVLQGTLIILVAFYVFVVSWNVTLSLFFKVG